MMEDMRVLFGAVLSGVLSFLAPISGDVYTMILIFVANFAVGYMAGRFVQGEDFNLKKALRCMEEALMFFAIVACIFAVGYFKGSEDGAQQCVSTVVYAVLYFYTTNCLRNLKALLKTGSPAYNAVSLLYYILSFEVIRRVPMIGEYVDHAGAGNAPPLTAGSVDPAAQPLDTGDDPAAQPQDTGDDPAAQP